MEKIAVWLTILLGSIVPGGAIGFFFVALVSALTPMQITGGMAIAIMTANVIIYAGICIYHLEPEDYKNFWR